MRLTLLGHRLVLDGELVRDGLLGLRIRRGASGGRLLLLRLALHTLRLALVGVEQATRGLLLGDSLLARLAGTRRQHGHAQRGAEGAVSMHSRSRVHLHLRQRLSVCARQQLQLTCLAAGAAAAALGAAWPCTGHTGERHHGQHRIASHECAEQSLLAVR